MDKPIIAYPCEWPYKIIGKDTEKIKLRLSENELALDYKMSDSKSSKTGKFSSINFLVDVQSEEERLKVFDYIKNLEGVMMVL